MKALYQYLRNSQCYTKRKIHSIPKDESVVMNWTTESLARKVNSGEKKNHKERRAVEIMLQQTQNSENLKTQGTEERIVGWLLFLLLNREGRNTTVKMKKNAKPKAKRKVTFRSLPSRRLCWWRKRRGVGGDVVQGSWATAHPGLFPPPPHENSAVPAGVDGR